MYVPGSDLTVDEAMVRFTGRSLETTTIPQKPTPTGYKIWVLGQSGYFVRWLWHVHGRGPCGLVPQQCSRQGDEELAREHLTPTQRVVTTFLTLLPLAVYHVFLDNLFASVKLFKALRSSQVGATGTCRKDSGVDELLVAEKDREGKGIPWGQMHCIPTKDGKVRGSSGFYWHTIAANISLPQRRYISLAGRITLLFFFLPLSFVKDTKSYGVADGLPAPLPPTELRGRYLGPRCERISVCRWGSTNITTI